MDLSWAFGALILEALAVLVLLIAAIVIMLWRRQKRDSRATHQLAASITSSQETRRHEINNLLTDVLQLEETEKQEVLQRLLEGEREFYQEFMRIYLLRDAAAMATLNDNVQRLTAPYHDLVRREIPQEYQATKHELPEEIAQEVQYDPEEDALRAELETLKSKNQTLETDIKLHQDILNRVFREYTALFGAEAPADKILSAQEIQKRMDSGSLGKPGDNKASKEE